MKKMKLNKDFQTEDWFKCIINIICDTSSAKRDFLISKQDKTKKH